MKQAAKLHPKPAAVVRVVVQHPAQRQCRPRQLAAVLAACSLLTLCPAAGFAQTLPGGLNIVQGRASVSTVGPAMTVSNTPNAILNWNSFSIGVQNSVRFEQQSAASQVLNRVTGIDPSSILGRLSSNGRVWLLNPNGVLFGTGARVDVAGLVTSTLNLNDSDWLAGRHLFSSSSLGTSVLNQGELRSSLGGSILLLGGSVRNEGLIDAPGGQVLLAAGQSIELIDTGAPRLSVRVKAAAGEALNLGTLAAAGGRIDIHAAIVNQQGVVRAQTLSSGAQGEILLRASQALNISSASSTRADGPTGGRITLDGGSGTTLVHGEASALGAEGKGGQITVLGRQVGLIDSARINVSGFSGGGEVRVGGGLQGRDTALTNAEAVFFGRNASITADATERGDGGRIILWSDRSTRAFGSLSTQGGRLSGDGGFIETSGGWLDARPFSIKTRAPHGKGGQWLLDPYDIYIVDEGANSNVDANFQPTGNDARINSATLVAALNSGTSVTISTSGGGTQNGDITLNSAHVVVGSSGGSGVRGHLTLQADRNIRMLNSQLSSQDQPFAITMSAARSGAGLGSIDISNSTLDSRGGDISLGGLGLASGSLATAPFAAAVGFGTAGVGVNLSNSTLNAGAGAVRMQGSSAAGGGAVGVKWYHSPVSAAVIEISGWAAAETGGSGVHIDGATARSGKRLLINGTGTANGVKVSTDTLLEVAPAQFDATDLLSITGHSSAAGGVGVLLDGTSTQLGLRLKVRGGAGLTILGSSLAGDNAVVLDGSYYISTPMIDALGSSGSVELRSAGNVGRIVLTDVHLRGSSNGLTLAGPQAYLRSSSINAAGPVRVFSNITTLGEASSIDSSASGDAIVLAGSQGNMSSFVNQAGSSSLQTGRGRWLIYARDPQNATAFAPANLAYAFKQYGATYPHAPVAAGIGNGYLFSTAVTATVSGHVSAKPYDGSRDAVTANLSVSGLLAGDTVVALSQNTPSQFADKNVGLTKSVDLGGLSVTFQDSNERPVYGYGLQSSLSGDVSPKQITGLVTGIHKIYDASAAASATVSQLSGLVGAESVTVQASGSFANKNVGTGKAVSVTYSLYDGLYGGLASNYSFASASTAITADITAASLAVTGLSADSKVYDAGRDATLTGAASFTTLGNDQLALSGSGLARFADKNVAVGKAVSVTGYTLSGTDAGNYLIAQPLGLTANITPAKLAVTGLSASSKVYDTTTAATLSGTAAFTALGNDQLVLNGSGLARFADKNVAVGKAVSVTGYTLSGTDASNYLIAQALKLTANITQASLRVTGLNANSKVYDTTTAATLSGTADFTALGTDQLTLSGSGLASFADKNVAVGKALSVTGYTLSGADAGNYLIAQPLGLTANITPAKLAVTGLSASSKVYDMTIAATLRGTAGITALGNDQLALSGSGLARFADKNAAVGKAVIVTGYTLSGGDADNYLIAQPTGLTANVTPANLAVTGLSANSKVYDTTTAATLSGTADFTALGTDQLTLSGSGLASFADKNVAVGKVVSVTGFALGGLDAGNYQLLSPLRLAANITPASLQYVADAATKRVGEALPVFSGGVTGFLGIESLQNASTGRLTFTSPANAISSAGNYAVEGSGLTAQNYNFSQAPGNAMALNVAAVIPEVPLVQSAVVALAAILQPQITVTGSAPSGMLNILSSNSNKTIDLADGILPASLGLTLAGSDREALSQAFGRQRLAGMSQEALAQMLSSRDHYKKSLFAEAIFKLEQDPSLGELRDCVKLSELARGNCLITADIKRQLKVLQDDREAQASVAPLTLLVPLVPVATVVVPTSDPQGSAVENALSLPSSAPAALLTAALTTKRRVKRAALPQIERKVAVMIGINDYADSGIPQLSNAVADSQAVGRLFGESFGYETVLLDNASKPSVVAALNQLALELGPRDSVVIYYAGHGEVVPSTGLGYWQLSDSDAKRPETWLSNADISRMIGQFGALQVALISDSCYSGSLVSEQRIRAAPGTVDPQAVLAKKSVVVMSSGGNEPVFDDGRDGHSLFAWNFMNSLKQIPSWQMGGNLFERVRFAVAKELPQRPQYGSSSAAGHQLGGDYLFEQRQLEAAN